MEVATEDAAGGAELSRDVQYGRSHPLPRNVVLRVCVCVHCNEACYLMDS